ncbi:Helix-turn-helix domain protein [compost metagenome]
MYEQLKNFEVIFKNSRYERVQVAYNQFWLNELEKGTVRSDLSVFKYDQDLLNEKRHLRLEEAKRQGISKPRIQNLTQSGIIELRAEWNGKMPQYFIAKDQMIEYQKIQEKYITKMKVAEILGVKKESVTQLIQEGWLTEAKLPYDHNYRFSKDEVEILLKTITGEYKPNADGIAFHKALNKYSIIGLTVSKLIKFIHQGLLHPQVKVKGGNLSSTFFRKEEIGQCIEVMKLSRREEKGMTLTEVIQYLHIGERKMKRYMITGELLPYTVVTWNDGRQRYFFHEVDVLAFEEKIIGAISKKYPMDVSL